MFNKISSYIRSKLDEFKAKVNDNQGLFQRGRFQPWENLKTNVGMIANPQTSGTWFQGFTPQMPQAVDNIVQNVQSLANPQIQNTWLQGLKPPSVSIPLPRINEPISPIPTPQPSFNVGNAFNRIKTNIGMLTNPKTQGTYLKGFLPNISPKITQPLQRTSDFLFNAPYAEGVLNRATPQNPVGKWLYHNVVWNPKEKQLLPGGPIGSFNRYEKGKKLYKQGKISKKQLEDLRFAKNFNPIFALTGGIKNLGKETPFVGKAKQLAEDIKPFEQKVLGSGEKGLAKIPKELEQAIQEAKAKGMSAEEFFKKEIEPRVNKIIFSTPKPDLSPILKGKKYYGGGLLEPKEKTIKIEGLYYPIKQFTSKELAKIRESEDWLPTALKNAGIKLREKPIKGQGLVDEEFYKDFYNQATKGVKRDLGRVYSIIDHSVFRTSVAKSIQNDGQKVIDAAEKGDVATLRKLQLKYVKDVGRDQGGGGAGPGRVKQARPGAVAVYRGAERAIKIITDSKGVKGLKVKQEEPVWEFVHKGPLVPEKKATITRKINNREVGGISIGGKRKDILKISKGDGEKLLSSIGFIKDSYNDWKRGDTIVSYDFLKKNWRIYGEIPEFKTKKQLVGLYNKVKGLKMSEIKYRPKLSKEASEIVNEIKQKFLESNNPHDYNVYIKRKMNSLLGRGHLFDEVANATADLGVDNAGFPQAMLKKQAELRRGLKGVKEGRPTIYSRTGVLGLKDKQYRRWKAQVKYADKKIQKGTQKIISDEERRKLLDEMYRKKPIETKGVKELKVKPQPKIKIKGIQPEKTIKPPLQPEAKTSVAEPVKAPKGVKPSKAKSVLDSIPPKDKIPFKHIVDENVSDVKKKVNILDYLATPKYVLEKMGLGKEAEQLDRAYDNYKIQIPKEIEKIGKWREQVPSKESSKKLFRYLDGQKVKLDKNELKVATDIKQYLSGWADKLGLPKDKRISNYITHIFERDFIKKEFDPELAKIIADKPAGSVYDPFLQKRLGKKGYVEDVWRALSAYTKRATRKFNLDPALKQLKESSKLQPLENLNYIKRLTHGINMRPAGVDNLIDNFIKQSPIGYKFGQRPTTVLTKALREQIYRGGLGFNIGSALKNLTQGINTYAELGEKYTAKGYLDLLTKGTKELYENGVLDSSFIEDKSLPVYKSFLKKLDEGLYYLFEKAEMINRGSAYYGAKARALAKGLSEKEAINEAKNVVAQTQFKFGGVHSPVILQSDLAKTLLQFQSYSIKQAEFLSRLAKNKEWKKLVRYILGTIVITGTIGKALGWDWKDISVPSLRFSSPTTSILGAGYKYITNTDKNKRAQAKRDLLKTGVLLIPAGAQGKKTIEGTGAYNRGYSQTPSGRLRYPIEKTSSARLKTALFGQYSVPEARTYFNKKEKPLGPKQTEKFKTEGIPYYNKVIAQREAKQQVKSPKKNIFNIFKKKQKPQGVDKYMVTYGYDKVLKQPEGTLQKYEQEGKKITAAVSIFGNSNIPGNIRPQMIKRLGFNVNDVKYEAYTRAPVQTKVNFLYDTLKDKPHKQVIKALLEGRKESLSGKYFTTQTVLKELYNKGLISYGEYKAIKSTSYNKNGRKKLGRSRKPKKLRIRKLRLYMRNTAPRIPVIRGSRVKLRKVSVKFPKRLKIRQNVGRINLKIPKLG